MSTLSLIKPPTKKKSNIADIEEKYSIGYIIDKYFDKDPKYQTSSAELYNVYVQINDLQSLTSQKFGRTMT
ncbi:MAG TPA: hypothetical protein PKI46_04270, partial [Bacteroidales bacterium]|nr:hypothetical protein [Bacteroidales bacterium]